MEKRYFWTHPLAQYHHQMTIDDFLFADEPEPGYVLKNEYCTKTVVFDHIGKKLRESFDTWAAIAQLKDFNRRYEPLREMPREDLYTEWKEPKHSGGWRPISAPKPQLKAAQDELVNMFENWGALYHTSAYAYIKGRCTVDAVQKHQKNKSWWFMKMDMSNFFGSITMEFVMQQLSMIFPFCQIIEAPEGAEELRKALDLGFLRGGLPQGTPLSPMLTNLIMIPLDFDLNKTLRDFDRKNFVYTRYADDIFISCKYTFNPGRILGLMNKILQVYHTPFHLNPKKTRYQSRSGGVWILGLNLNNENKITIGHKKKAWFKRYLDNFAMDLLSGNVELTAEDIQGFIGNYSYFHAVEPEVMEELLAKRNAKFGFDILAKMKEMLNGGGE